RALGNRTPNWKAQRHPFEPDALAGGDGARRLHHEGAARLKPSRLSRTWSDMDTDVPRSGPRLMGVASISIRQSRIDSVLLPRGGRLQNDSSGIAFAALRRTGGGS